MSSALSLGKAECGTSHRGGLHVANVQKSMWTTNRFLVALVIVTLEQQTCVVPDLPEFLYRSSHS